MHDRTKRVTPPLAVIAFLVAGCGSQASPDGAAPSQSSNAIPGTRPSSSIPPGFRTDATAAPSAGLTPTGTPSAATSDPVEVQLTDNRSNDYVTAADAGDLIVMEIGIHGVGKIWADRDPTLRRTASGVVLHYSGPGRVDRRARLGDTFGDTRTVDPRQARLRIEARVDSDGVGRATSGSTGGTSWWPRTPRRTRPTQWYGPWLATSPAATGTTSRPHDHPGGVEQDGVRADVRNPGPRPAPRDRPDVVRRRRPCVTGRDARPRGRGPGRPARPSRGHARADVPRLLAVQRDLLSAQRSAP